MATTKERILEAALRLFARDGYQAVSTSAIAGELGMAKSALYKHFPDTRAIFDCLVDQMIEHHRSVGEAAGLAEDAANTAAAQTYADATPAQMAELGEALFRYWTQDPSASAFRRMLAIERFRDERIAGIYDEMFVSGKLRYHTELFGQMVGIGAFEPGDARQMALDFWAPVLLLMQAVDGGLDMEEAVAAVRSHVLAFAARYVRSHDE